MQETNTKPTLRIRPSEAADAERLAYIQETVFPSLAPEERMRAEHFAFHVGLFPEGQWVVMADDAVVASTSSIRYAFDPSHPVAHRFAEVFDSGYLRSHDPAGNWLYGMDMAVLPEYRGMGIARLLYRERQHVVRRLGLDGQVTVGMLNGYLSSGYTSVYAYFEAVKQGEVSDPTVSVQLRMGFRILALIEDYLNDPTCGHAGVLMAMPADTIV